MPAGRPTSYRPEYCQMLIDDMAKGFSFEAFAGLINVHVDTLYEWCKVHPEFSDAKKEAFQKSRRFWEGQGVDGMWTQSGPGGQNFNATVWIFNMKNRFKWRDKQPDEENKNPITLNVQPGSKPEEILDLMNKLEKREPKQ